MSNFVVSTVPADGLVPLVVKASAGTVITKFKSGIYTDQAHKQLVIYQSFSKIPRYFLFDFTYFTSCRHLGFTHINSLNITW